MSIDIKSEHRDRKHATPPIWARIASIAKCLILVILILGVLHPLGVVGIVYVHRIDNDPFRNPVEVSEVTADRIKLKDGRTFVPYGGIDDRTKEKVREAGMRVDLEVDETNLVTIYGRHDIFVCGLGMPLITIPIIPSKIPKYNRTLLPIGELEELPRATEFKGCPEEQQRSP